MTLKLDYITLRDVFKCKSNFAFKTQQCKICGNTCDVTATAGVPSSEQNPDATEEALSMYFMFSGIEEGMKTSYCWTAFCSVLCQFLGEY